MSMYRPIGTGLGALLALTLGALLPFALGGASSANAQANPKFEYVKKEEAKAVAAAKPAAPLWNVSAQAGLLLTTGNASQTTLSSGFRASRKSGNNKLQLELQGAFARSTIYLASDENGNEVVDENELTRITKTASQSWLVKTRYDRFLNPRNALYISSAISADEPAGKVLIGSGQLGYSRTVVESEVHQLVLESGYDFSYEDRGGSDKSVSIHSWRVFAGYTGKLSPDTSLEVSTESLFNLNELETSSGPVTQFSDTRFNNQVSLTTSVYGDLSFRFSFQSKFDNNPAARPELDLPYAAGFAPSAAKLDTRTEAAIIVNFL